MVIPVSPGRSETIRRNVSSLLRQPGVELEIILVYTQPGLEETPWLLNRFPDATILECNYYSYREPHGARLKGYELATHEHIHLLDDDDTVPVNWYSQVDFNADINWSMSRVYVRHGGGGVIRECDKYWKTNVGGVIWKRSVLDKVFDIVPEDIPPFIEPYLYMLVAYHALCPTYNVMPIGIIRGFFEGETWSTMNMDAVTAEHYSVWKEFLGKPIPTHEDRDLNQYFQTYGNGLGPWRK